MENPVQKIRRLQHSINYKSRQIKCLTKQRNRYELFLDSLMGKTVPKLRSVFKKSIIEQTKPNNIMVKNRDDSNKNTGVKSARDSSLQKSKAKEEIANSKIQKYTHLKELSRNHLLYINKKRQKELEAKRQRKFFIRQSEFKSKEAVRKYHEDKKKYIRQSREQQQKQVKNYAEKLEAQHKKIQNQYCNALRIQRQTSQKVRMFNRTFGNFRTSNFSHIFDQKMSIPQEQMRGKDIKKYFEDIYLAKQNIL